MTKKRDDDKKRVANPGDEPVCDYCGKNSKQAGILVEGPVKVAGRQGAKPYICPSCIELCSNIVKQRMNKREVSLALPKEVPTPREIVTYLDQYIIGQERAKRVLSVAVANHYKRLRDDATRFDNYDVEDPLAETCLEKSNVLLIGPTGSGKTLLAKTLAKILQVPFAIGDATTLTEAGYVGEDVENLLLKLLHAADFDVEAAQRGILFIDEIDKIGRTNNNVSITRDVSGEGVQQSLLKMIEGTVANVPPSGGRKHPEQQYVPVDTSNILFICGGTFTGLDEIIAKRVGHRTIGFGSTTVSTTEEKDKRKLLEQVTDEDLVKYGLIPEFVGRLPVISPVQGLDEDGLVAVLTEPKDSLVKQYQKLFRYDDVELEFTPEGIREIARQAAKKGTGARALRSVIENFMTDILFELPDHAGEKVVITEKIVKSKAA